MQVTYVAEVTSKIYEPREFYPLNQDVELSNLHPQLDSCKHDNKPEFSCTIFGGHFESENEQKTQQSPAEGFNTSLQLVHL